ncbi:lantibiotic dehydratase [Micromonospora sp. NBC_01796]|uniref:lantibiotic dehydratase n=1 Tax=Micromonospora sp. NBC_01796 TaxID=2975987 RepID=UPI002DDB0E79|nr:lantibiotic dehydratase [Micromonospora sp. NBC_01796]WSA86415.1 lantibiotic dehydratase family protein [Micromonospora sp. NBC_01796]
MPADLDEAPAGERVTGAAPHLTPLVDGEWALWWSVCLRGTGFPFDLLDGLASPALAATADQLITSGAPAAGTEAYRERFRVAGRDLAAALHRVAAEPRFREAVTWQNPHAVRTGLDTLLRRDPDTVVRTARHRRYEALVTNYLHRYCAKNDTIGFFGPVGWAEIVPDQVTPLRHSRTADPVAARTLYFEHWAVAAVAVAHAPALRRWLAPRRMPLLDVVDGALRVPLADPVPLDPCAAAVLRACDGVRLPDRIVAEVLADPSTATTDPAEVFATLDRLHAARWITWDLEAPADDLRSEITLRGILDRVDDPAVRAPAVAALAELTAARDAVAAARGDDRALLPALDRLDATFTRLTDLAARRDNGQAYAGRTLVFEECRRADEVTLGPALLEPLRAPLGLVLDSARWFTSAGAALYRRAFRDLYRQLAGPTGAGPVPFAEFWLLAHDLLVQPAESLVRPLTRALQARWARILALPTADAPGAGTLGGEVLGVGTPGGTTPRIGGPERRRVHRDSAALRAAVRGAFPAARPGWTGAVQHSPDLMLAAADPAAIEAGDFEWILGELHPGANTMRYASWYAYHPEPERMRAAMAADLSPGVVLMGATEAQGGTPVRTAPELAGPGDVRLVFAPDTCGYDPDRDLLVGACELYDSGGRLVVRRRSGGPEYELLEVVADLVSARLVQQFRLLPPAPHTPRVQVDRLVIHRESWTFGPGDLTLFAEPDEADRFLAVRRWVARHGLPRYVFARVTGERKPIHLDLTSLASVDVLARAVRRATRLDPDGARVTVTEMLPGPDQLWLADTAGRRYCAEFRFVAVDRTTTR